MEVDKKHFNLIVKTAPQIYPYGVTSNGNRQTFTSYIGDSIDIEKGTNILQLIDNNRGSEPFQDLKFFKSEMVNSYLSDPINHNILDITDKLLRFFVIGGKIRYILYLSFFISFDFHLKTLNNVNACKYGYYTSWKGDNMFAKVLRYNFCDIDPWTSVYMLMCTVKAHIESPIENSYHPTAGSIFDFIFIEKNPANCILQSILEILHAQDGLGIDNKDVHLILQKCGKPMKSLRGTFCENVTHWATCIADHNKRRSKKELSPSTSLNIDSERKEIAQSLIYGNIGILKKHMHHNQIFFDPATELYLKSHLSDIFYLCRSILETIDIEDSRQEDIIRDFKHYHERSKDVKKYINTEIDKYYNKLTDKNKKELPLPVLVDKSH
jgi:hypothetical protein